MGGGGGTPDYSQSINQAQKESNQPKSYLAQQLSGYFSSLLPQVPYQQSQNTPVQNGNVQNISNILASSGNHPTTPVDPTFKNPDGTTKKPDLIPNANTPQLSPYGNDTGVGGIPNGNMQLPSGFSPTAPGTNPLNPFQFLGNNREQANVYGVANSGLQDPRLTGMQPQGNSFNPLTANSGMAFSQNVPGLGFNFNPQTASLGSTGGVDPSIINALQQHFSSPANGIFNAQGANINSSGIQDTAFSQGVQQALANKQNQDIADLRARFGAAGGTSRGTPAAFAEAQLRAQQAPEIAAALGQIRQNEAGLNIQDLTQQNNANLQGRGQNINAGLETNQLNAGNTIAAGNLGLGQGNINLGARGQDLSNFQGAQNNIISQLGLALSQNQNTLQNNQFNAGQFNNVGLQNRGYNLQDLNNQFNYSLGAGGLNSNNAQFNAGQTNQLSQNYANNMQQANQNMLNNNSNSMNQLAAFLAAIAGQGIPGGSFNANVSPVAPSQGNTLGSTLAGAGQLAEGASAIWKATGH